MIAASIVLTILTTIVSIAAADAQPAFNIFQGPEVQVSTDTKPAKDLTFTTSGGVSYFNPFAVDRLGNIGPLLLQNFNLFETFAHFVRERVPERTVHAKGAGAHGFFEVTTKTGAKFSQADLFSNMGKKTPLTARFSTILGNLGSPDSVRDLRGLGFKIRTNEGILDWVFLNSPIFWIRDPAKLPHLIHSQKRHPSTNLPNSNDFWDFVSANNETIHQLMMSMSDLGTPFGFRHMDGFSGNTFRAIAKDGSWNYIKISAISNQGAINLNSSESARIAGSDPDFSIRDLYDSIAKGDFPSWTVYFQVMSPADAEKFKYNIFDLTKQWLPEVVPRQEIGRITLNQNPTNYFQEVEQIGFEPGQLVPGLEPTEDPILQARLVIYGDAQRYRTGINRKQLPVNAPLNPVASFDRDGAMAFSNQGSRPNFMSTQDPINLAPRLDNDDNHTIWVGGAVKYVSTPAEIDFEQPRQFWVGLNSQNQTNLISNIVGSLGQATNVDIKTRMCRILAHVNSTLGMEVAKAVNVTL